MYLKGKSFVGAAILTHRQSDSEHNDYVVLHLLCQGMEVVLKGLLLLKDYDRNILRLKPLGHNIFKVTEEVSAAYGLKPMCANLERELRDLNKLYTKQLLRYWTGYDILVDPRTIPRDRVLRRLCAAIRLAERELRRAHA